MHRALLCSLPLMIACGDDVVGRPDAVPPGIVPTDASPLPRTPEGSFRVVSTLELSTRVPETVATIDTVIAATDEPSDPTKFLLEQIVDALPAGVPRAALQAAAPALAALVNERVLDASPRFVETLVEIGRALGDASRNLGTIATFDITTSGDGTATLIGIVVDRLSMRTEIAFAGQGVPNVTIGPVRVALAPTDTVGIARHVVPLPYGVALRLALDRVILPSIVPGSTDLEQLLPALVDCGAVGAAIDDAIVIGTPSLYTAACTQGLAAAGRAFYRRLASVGTLSIELTGSAGAVDRDSDGKLDELSHGVWTGTAAYGASSVQLSTSTFTATRS